MISEDRRLMDLKDLKRLSEGIVMPSNKVDNMLQECQLKYGKRKDLRKNEDNFNFYSWDYILRMLRNVYETARSFCICIHINS